MAIAATTTTPVSRYFREIHKVPMLAAEEEFRLARRWRDLRDINAADKLVASHLRLVVKIAVGYRGYGLPLNDLISEGNCGMVQAVKQFDPERGFRLATYAMWWIRAAIAEYVLRSSSLVKIGTTSAQKKLFFNLRKLKGRMQAAQEADLEPAQVTKIAKALKVPELEVIRMNSRLTGPDHSLNAPMNTDGAGQWQDQLVDQNETQEEALAEREELGRRRTLLARAWPVLIDRERHIMTERRLVDNPTTLEKLSLHYGISCERVRQIETRAFQKLQKAIKAQMSGTGRAQTVRLSCSNRAAPFAISTGRSELGNKKLMLVPA
jgi:RNA polymerase sigma-32 factor